MLIVHKGFQIEDCLKVVDYSLVNEGLIVTDDYFSILINDKLHAANHTTKDLLLEPYNLMLVHAPSAKGPNSASQDPPEVLAFLTLSIR